MRFPIASCCVALVALALGTPAAAEACGGCFQQTASPTVVSGHRMALSISSQQSVLWDQIQYAGDPAEFAWVLPVKPGARVEASTDAFFEVLEAGTARRVVAPQENCGSSGAGCGSSLALASGEAAPTDNSDVTVVHEGTVGPYETVTLEASKPGALNAWLASHGYNVDASSQPIIDEYVAEGFDFIAMRLLPDKNVRQMTPVRIVTPGGSAALPLRMVAIGTGANVPIVLYVIGEGRWSIKDAPIDNVDTELLSFDFKDKTSNYGALRDAALAKNGGLGWLAAYADRGLFSYDGGANQLDFPAFDFLGSYGTQAISNNETDASCRLTELSDGTAQIVDPCPGQPWTSACGAGTSDQLDVRKLVCKGADDMGVALLGMHVNDIWLTRLETNLPHAALDKDLVLEPAAAQVSVPRTLNAKIAENVDKACPSTVLFPTVSGPRKSPPGSTPALFAVFLALSGAALVMRRNGVLARPRGR